jgi:hypothetical protein
MEEQKTYQVEASGFCQDGVKTIAEAEELVRSIIAFRKKAWVYDSDGILVAQAHANGDQLFWDVHPIAITEEPKLDGGVAMARLRLIGGGARRTFVSLEDKIKAISSIYVRSVPTKEVLGPLYVRAGKDLPKNTSIVLANWRKAIQDKLDADDEYTISLCKQFGVVVEEEGEPSPKPTKKKAAKKETAA